MSNPKIFYWLKLTETFFDDETIAWLEEHPNGATYVMFYLKLCLKSLQTDGILIRNVGEMLIPYDAKKLAEITHTEINAVVVAMQLLAKSGLIKILENGAIYLSRIAELVGKDTSEAIRKRKTREKQRLRLQLNQESGTMSQENGTMSQECPTNVPPEIRDIEIRDIEIRDIDDVSAETSPTPPRKSSKKFQKPTIEEIAEYCRERKNNVNPERFYDFYEAKGWFVGKNKMKDWKAAVRTWENRDSESKKAEPQPQQKYQFGKVV